MKDYWEMWMVYGLAARIIANKPTGDAWPSDATVAAREKLIEQRFWDRMMGVEA